MNRTHDRTTIQLFAVATGIKSLLSDALADFAVVAAIGEFYTLGPAAHAIDGGSRNLRGIVHHAPLLGGRFAQLVVICDGRYAGIAFLAIQSAAAD